MKYTIYKTVNQINGHEYIGKHQTNDPNDDYIGSGKRLRRAIEKYGRSNFKKEILFVFDTEHEMNVKEAELVTEEYCQRKDTYNLCSGGQGGWSYINNNALNIKGLYASGAASKRKWETDEDYRKKVLENLSKRWIGFGEYRYDWTGKKHKSESIMKMKSSAKGKHNGDKNSQYGTCWITNGEVSKKINKNEVIPDGWYRGRVIKYGNVGK